VTFAESVVLLPSRLSTSRNRRERRIYFCCWRFFLVRVFLDTSALIALSGLRGTSVADAFVKTCEKAGVVLCVSHVQVDEKVPREMASYEERIDRAVKILRDIGLEVLLEATPIAVYDTSRYGMSKYGGDDENALYEKLLKLISECDRAMGKNGEATRDAIIGVSALDHDLFVVCDECLYRGVRSATADWAAIQKRLPKTILTKPNPEDVAKGILDST
jgi:hypothetical protein